MSLSDQIFPRLPEYGHDQTPMTSVFGKPDADKGAPSGKTGDPDADAAKELATENPVKQLDNMGAAIETAEKSKSPAAGGASVAKREDEAKTSDD